MTFPARPLPLLGLALLLASGATGAACRRDAGGGDSGDGAATGAATKGDRAPEVSPYYERVREDVEQLGKLVRMQPKNAKLRVELGRKLLEGGMAAAGEKQLRLALKLQPTNDEARAVLGRNLLERQEAERAATLVEEGLRLEESAALWALRGTISLASNPGELAPAIEAFDRALELDSRTVEAAYERARIALRQGDAPLAVSLLERVLALRENHLGAAFNLVRALRATGDDAGADRAAAVHRRLSWLEDLSQLDHPHSVEAYVALGEMLLDGGAVEDGFAELRAGIARHPSAPLLRVRLALALARQKRGEDARAAFETALKEVPRAPMILNQYAWYLATRGRPKEQKRALKLAEEAVALTDREDPQMLDTLAEARAANGDHRGALAAISEAIRLRPNDPSLARRRERFARKAGGS